MRIKCIRLYCNRLKNKYFPYQETGRNKGFGTNVYFQSINDIDTEIGKIVAYVKEMGMAQNTTLIITSDHGGNGFENGNESMADIEVPWIINGPGVKKTFCLKHRTTWLTLLLLL